MSTLTFCQDRYESPEDDDLDPLADALNECISELQMAQRIYARQPDEAEMRRVWAAIREVRAMLAEVDK